MRSKEIGKKVRISFIFLTLGISMWGKVHYLVVHLFILYLDYCTCFGDFVFWKNYYNLFVRLIIFLFLPLVREHHTFCLEKEGSGSRSIFTTLERERLLRLVVCTKWVLVNFGGVMESVRKLWLIEPL